MRASVEDRKQADLLSGVTWNIITNSDASEVYLPHARQLNVREKCLLDPQLVAVRTTFDQKQYNPELRKGTLSSLQGSGVKEAFAARPESAGKYARSQEARRQRNIAQVTSPRSFAGFQASQPPATARLPRSRPNFMVPLPSGGAIREEWATRRGELTQTTPRPPPSSEMFKEADQVRADHISGSSTARAKRRDPGAEFCHHSSRRVEPSKGTREISEWMRERSDKHHRQDAYYSKPAKSDTASSVKYDVVTNQPLNFWY